MTDYSENENGVYTAAPAILTAAGALLARYDVLFCDVWGVVHDGHNAYAGAVEALQRFRAQGGSVILVSNAPVPTFRVEKMLDLRGVARSAWDDIVSSGAIALAHVVARGYQRVYYIGPRDRDAAFFDSATARPAALEEAEAIVCTGLNDDIGETAETYRALLTLALDRKLPFVCANPDLVVDVGGRHYLCAGAIADLYEHMGGGVFWAGKPHSSAYASALSVAERLRGSPIPKRRILVIGDALRTDLKGAANAGLDALFIAGGIHRGETMQDGRIVPDRLAALFGSGAPRAIAAMPELQW